MNDSYHIHTHKENNMKHDTKKRKRRPNGEGSFYIKNGKLVGAFQRTIDGKRKVITITGTSQEEILEKAQHIQAISARNSFPFKAHTVTLSQLINFWMETIKKRSVKPKTFQKYESCFRLYVFPHLGKKKLTTLTTAMIQSLINDLSDGVHRGEKSEKLSSSTIRTTRRYLIESLDYAVNNDLITKNPAKLTKPPRLEKREIHPLTSDEVTLLLNAMKQQVKTAMDGYNFIPYYASYIAVLLAVTTGMRLGEVFGLCWDCVDFKRNTIAVMRTVNTGQKERISNNTKTRTSRRSIQVSPHVMEELQLYQQKQSEFALFLGDKWHPMVPQPLITGIYGNLLHTSNFKSRYFIPILKKLHLEDITFHDLRHTHATLLMQAKVNPKIVQERLGHSTITLTLDTYSHLVPDIQKEAVNALEKLGL